MVWPLIAIPACILTDTCTVRVPVESDYGGEFAEPVEIGNVRFERRDPFHPDALSLGDGAKGILFVDAVNSEGAFAIPSGSLVKVGDVEMVAGSVAEFIGFGGRVHHWEVELR